MSDRWQEFVGRVSTPPPDDPFVRLLRERLATGSRLIRVNLLEGSGSSPEYLVILSTQRVLQEIHIPHSDGFTRWSFEAGAKLENGPEETRRFKLLLGERLAPIEREVGRDYFEAVLVSHVRELAPPHSTAMLGEHFVHKPSVGKSLLRTMEQIEAALGELASALRTSLRYSISEAAGILDDALAAWLDERLLITARKDLGW